MHATSHKLDMIDGHQSLLGYLNPIPGGGVYLRLPLNRTETQEEGKEPICWEEAGPVADLAQAPLSFAGQAPAADLFLLFQADTPRTGGGELEALSNKDIEELWREALSNAEPPAVSLCRRDGQGQWQSCLPLFACNHKAVFFHPPCPRCGANLILCRDDHLLAQAGVPAYSSSLVRYLYCDHCFTADPVLYIKAHGGEPRPGVVDGKTLIGQFSQLLTKDDLAEKLPCIGCELSSACYGPENQVFQRLTAVRFYPFYLLSQPAQSINALDFLALLAGADAGRLEDELATHAKWLRLAGLRRTTSALGGGSGLLFARDQRYFAELLYLKLAFLSRLIDLAVLQPAPLDQVVRKMSLEGVWVRLAEKTHHLPLFWNFDLCCVDRVGAPAGPSPRSDITPVQTRLFLGRSWFYVLLTNDRQSFADVLKTIDQLAGEPSMPEAAGELAPLDPRHIFYGQTLPAIDEPWLTFWRRTIDLGLTFFKTDGDDRCDPVDDAIARTLDQLRGDLHQALFSAPAGAVRHPAREPGQVPDQPIKAILETILAKWTREAGLVAHATENKPSAIRVDKDGDVEETIILTDTKASGDTRVESTSPERDEPKTDELEKTLVVRTSDAPAVPPKTQSPGLEKTIVIAPGQTSPAPGHDLEKTVVLDKADGSAARSDDLEKTVLTSPGARQTAVETQPPERSSSPPPDDEMEQTVIQGSGPGVPSPVPPDQRRAAEHDDQDDLEATVIIDPAHLKNRKR